VARPVVLLSYFELEDLPRILDAIEPAGIPNDVHVYVGSYGINAQASTLVRSVRQGRYAPMLPVQPSGFYVRRRLSPREEAKVPSAYSGRVPALTQLSSLSPRQRVTWGRELGRRFRDALRAARREGVRVDSWQFDEIPSQAARSRAYRDFVRGVLAGLTFGRAPLGDREQHGFVWSPLKVLRLARAPLDPELTAFWRQLDRAAFRLAGEEFPVFAGDPRAAARAQAAAQRALAAQGVARRSLAAKYVAGMTPGHHLAPGLGGNVRRWRRDRVLRWRTAYVEERARLGVAGLGEFNFREENASDAVIRDTLRALAAGLVVTPDVFSETRGRRPGPAAP
jgi:hypothetical protein